MKPPEIHLYYTTYSQGNVLNFQGTYSVHLSGNSLYGKIAGIYRGIGRVLMKDSDFTIHSYILAGLFRARMQNCLHECTKELQGVDLVILCVSLT